MSDAVEPVYVNLSIQQSSVKEPVGRVMWAVDPDMVDGLTTDVSEAVGVRRRQTSNRSKVNPAVASDRAQRSSPDPKIDLVLYTSGASEKSQRALRTIRQVLAEYNPAQVRFVSCDLLECPTDGDTDAVMFTPTLVKKGPGPRITI